MICTHTPFTLYDILIVWSFRFILSSLVFFFYSFQFCFYATLVSANGFACVNIGNYLTGKYFLDRKCLCAVQKYNLLFVPNFIQIRSAVLAWLRYKQPSFHICNDSKIKKKNVVLSRNVTALRYASLDSSQCAITHCRPPFSSRHARYGATTLRATKHYAA